MPHGLMPSHAAAMGRGGDTEVGHLTEGEVVVPRKLAAEPDLRAQLIQAFERAGVPMGRYTVGGRDDSRNPETGMREYYSPGGSGGGPDSSGPDGGPGGGGGGSPGGDGGPGSESPSEGFSGPGGQADSPSRGGPSMGGDPGGGDPGSGTNFGLANFNDTMEDFALGLVPGLSFARAMDPVTRDIAEFFGVPRGPVGSTFDHNSGTFFSPPSEVRGGDPGPGRSYAAPYRGNWVPQTRDYRENYSGSGFYTPPANRQVPSWQRYLNI